MSDIKKKNSKIAPGIEEIDLNTLGKALENLKIQDEDLLELEAEEAAMLLES